MAETEAGAPGGEALPYWGEEEEPAPPSSRLCVKNIPKHLTLDRLREHFAERGLVTDAKIMKTGCVRASFARPRSRPRRRPSPRARPDAASRLSLSSRAPRGRPRVSPAFPPSVPPTSPAAPLTPPPPLPRAVFLPPPAPPRDGKSRQMAFVGFKTTAEATSALEYFNNTFVDTSKISVEYARAVKSSALPRPWSRHSEGSSAHARSASAEGGAKKGTRGGDKDSANDPDRFIGVRELKKMKNAKKHAAERALEEKIAADPKLAEFMQLMAPRSKGRIWDNQDAVAHAGAEGDRDPAVPRAGDAGDPGASHGEKPAFEDDDGSDDDAYDNTFDDDVGKAGTAKGVKKMKPAGAEPRDARKKQAWDGTFTDSDEDSDSDSEDEDASGSSDADSDDVADDEGVSDMEYLKKRSGAFSDTDEDEDEDEEDEDEDEEEDDGDDEDADEAGGEAGGEKASGVGASGLGASREKVLASDMEAVADTGRVFVRNLPFTATEEEVAERFAEFGALTAVHVIVDRATRRSKGLAYVTYALPEHGVRAMEEADGTIFQGRLMHVLPAKRPPAADAVMGGVGRVGNAGEEQPGDDGTPEDGAEGRGGFKASRDAKLKSDAATNRAAWNSLFMRQDTVAAAVAEKYGVTKAELLESGDADVAVRLALGEAQIIAETKAQLEEAGADVKALERAAAAGGAKAAAGASASAVTRSGCAILLKNLPYETTEQDLRAMCERHGALARLVLPDTRALAIAEWLEPGDARKAFKGLAYKRYKHVPMYVEWAPHGIFSDDAPRRSATAGGSAPRADAGPGARAGPGGPPGEEEDAEEGEEEEDGDEEASRLFVKGLSFQTSDAALRAHFLRAAQTAGGRVLAATVATQKGPGGANLSRGFGFVEFDTPNAARAARRAMQGKPLEGRALSLELSSGGGGGGAGDRSANPNKSSSSSKVPPGMSATKIVVRNVAFEATRRDVQKLFNPFGTLKSCRLPKKFDGAHRGFAFVELATRRETSAALEALAGTHLYGRRLVIERAALEDDVETVREKTARRFAESAAASSGAPTRKKPKTGKAY